MKKDYIVILVIMISIILYSEPSSALTCTWEEAEYYIDPEFEDCSVCFTSETCHDDTCWSQHSETCSSDWGCSGINECQYLGYTCESAGCSTSQSYREDNDCTSLCDSNLCDSGSCATPCGYSPVCTDTTNYANDDCGATQSTACDGGCTGWSGGIDCTATSKVCDEGVCVECKGDGDCGTEEYCSFDQVCVACDYDPTCTQSTLSTSNTNCGATRSSTIACNGGCETTTWSGGTPCSASETCTNGVCCDYSPACTQSTLSTSNTNCGATRPSTTACTGGCETTTWSGGTPCTATSQVCNSAGSCVTACTPSCAGKTCGASDGCTGTCGSTTDSGCPCNDNNGCTTGDAYNSAGNCVGTNVAAGNDPNNACTASGCTATGYCDGAGACQGNVASGTDPNSACTASGCTYTDYCDGSGSCQTPSSGTDPNSYCGALDCDGGATKYYWGWDTDNTCYYKSDVTAANAHCDGSGSCRSTATECSEEGKGATTGITYHSSCRSGCSGTTAPSTANEGTTCDTGKVCSGGSCTAPCTGTISLALDPNSVDAGSSVTPSASGLSGCSKTIYFKQDSCTGTQVSSCSSTDTGCTGGSFTAPTSEGGYDYYACVDKDSNSDFSGSGESGSATLAVETSSTFPLCNRATPTITSSSWSVANDCWGTPQQSCKDGLIDCTTWCTPFNSMNKRIGDYSSADQWTMQKGKWKVIANMKNINSYAKCHGRICWGVNDCFSNVKSATLVLAMDGTEVGRGSSSPGASVQGDSTIEQSLAIAPIELIKTIDCTSQTCQLNIQRYFSFEGRTFRMPSPGGSGDFYYGQVAADVSVSLQQVECAVNDNADGTSTECINLYGVSKPVCDTATGLCKNTCTNCENAKSMDKTSISLGETASGLTCSLISASAPSSNDWFKITANNNGKLIVEMTPSAANLDLEVDKEKTIGGGCNNLVQVGTSTKSGASKETVTANVIAGYTYWIKTYYSSGSATGTVTAKLVECTANNALDAACPSAKPYCSNNKCVECYSNNLIYFIDANNDGIDDNANNDRSSQCPATKKRCNTVTFICQIPEACNTNADCIPGECCGIDSTLPSSFRTESGLCLPLGDKRTPGQPSYLCA